MIDIDYHCDSKAAVQGQFVLQVSNHREVSRVENDEEQQMVYT